MKAIRKQKVRTSKPYSNRFQQKRIPGSIDGIPTRKLKRKIRIPQGRMPRYYKYNRIRKIQGRKRFL